MAQTCIQDPRRIRRMVRRVYFWHEVHDQVFLRAGTCNGDGERFITLIVEFPGWFAGVYHNFKFWEFVDIGMGRKMFSEKDLTSGGKHAIKGDDKGFF